MNLRLTPQSQSPFPRRSGEGELVTPPRRNHRRPRPSPAAGAFSRETQSISANSRTLFDGSAYGRSTISASEESQSFEDTYRSYRSRIYRLCLRMVRNPADAEELTQDTFVRAFQKQQQFQGRAAFSTWLYRVAVNVVLMWLRKRSHREGPLEETLIPEADGHQSSNRLVPYGGRPQEGLEQIFVKVAVGSLPARYRRALLLHDVEGYQHREIAKLTGWSVSASKSNLYRAHLRLRKLFIAGGGNSPARSSPLADSSVTGV